ncbi:hypothetical protein C8J57DRAFT_1728663 [Mycena rebaudengoi]|nr:hypothetical protein C8J57DRAFT_1728663 [Mycena rebaudengoi]
MSRNLRVSLLDYIHVLTTIRQPRTSYVAQHLRSVQRSMHMSFSSSRELALALVPLRRRAQASRCLGGAQHRGVQLTFRALEHAHPHVAFDASQGCVNFNSTLHGPPSNCIHVLFDAADQ